MLNWGGLDGLNFYANLLQVASYEQLLKQANNDDILRELKRQNKKYLEKILSNQDKIIKLLERVIDERNKRNTD